VTMTHDFIDIRKLSIDELAGVVNLYPWYGGARLELCRRMTGIGGDSWGRERFADAAMYVSDRQTVSDLWRSGKKEDCSDKDVGKLLEFYIQGDKADGQERKVRSMGGDYFSQDQYDSVRKDGDDGFSRFALTPKVAPDEESDKDEVLPDDFFCTEAMAQIYEEQGYYKHARSIYSRLRLKFPEKSVYFASLIENLDNKTYER